MSSKRDQHLQARGSPGQTGAERVEEERQRSSPRRIGNEHQDPFSSEVGKRNLARKPLSHLRVAQHWRIQTHGARIASKQAECQSRVLSREPSRDKSSRNFPHLQAGQKVPGSVNLTG